MGTLAKVYAPIPELSIGLGVAGAGAWVTARLIRRPFAATPWLARRLSTTPRRIAVVVLVSIVIAAGIRGSVGRRPVQEKDAAITPDPVLAGLVLNPYESLRYAVKHYWKVVGGRGLETYLPDGDIAGALQELAGRPVRDIDSALVRVAPGRGAADPPRHVFLVVMESYDGWTLLDEYAPLGLSNGLRGLASGGLLLRNFLSASSGTMTSVAAIITGLPDAGIVTNREPSARAPYPSSLAAIFRSLGYRTQLFYGGYLSWQEIGAFAKAQGFDRVYGGAHMGSWLETNEWGVDDEALFDFVSRTISDDEPTFDLILSGSNHPPYDLDVYGKGFPLKTVPERYRDGFEHGNADLVQLGHHWYADRAVSRWVARMAERFPSALFAVTGDHWSRRFIGPRPDLFVRSAVPLLLYGPPFRNAKLPEGAVGSHLDIGPTLISRVAERGFVYHATGHDLLGPDRPTVAIARRAMIGSGVILDPSRPGTFERLPGASGDAVPIDPKAWRRRYSVLEAVAWWRMMRGNELSGAEPPHPTEVVRRSAANLPAIHQEDRP
jgi:hypothetical protein